MLMSVTIMSCEVQCTIFIFLISFISFKIFIYFLFIIAHHGNYLVTASYDGTAKVCITFNVGCVYMKWVIPCQIIQWV